MAEIHFNYKKKPRKIYAKLENFNLTGSIKDCMAYHILNSSYKNGTIKKGDQIVEATSGNTGISLAAIGTALGHPVQIIMPNWMSTERINLIKSFGAQIKLVSKEEGGFLGSIKMTEEIAHNNPNVFLPRQFENQFNSYTHFQSTAPEIWCQSLCIDEKLEAFVAGVGTGGTVMGVGRYFKKLNSHIKIHPFEPASSPTLTTGYKVGSHRIQGISDEFIPAIVNLKQLDDIIQVEDGDAIIMAQKLANKLGLGVGISSGANFLGAIQAQNKIGAKATVVTVFSDSNKKYGSTDLSKEEPIIEKYMTNDIELLDYKVIKGIEMEKEDKAFYSR